MQLVQLVLSVITRLSSISASGGSGLMQITLFAVKGARSGSEEVYSWPGSFIGLNPEGSLSSGR
jgi:hypothetical protein